MRLMRVGYLTYIDPVKGVVALRIEKTFWCCTFCGKFAFENCIHVREDEVLATGRIKIWVYRVCG